MKGTVGSGKSTYSQKIKDHVEELGGYCVVEGMDKYTKTGMSYNEAQIRVKESLLKVDTVENDLLVVIIDTCGEYDVKKVMKIFDVDFTGWTKEIYWPNLIREEFEGYMAWSLYNVLKREKASESDHFSLNPVSAGTNKCIEVHLIKCKKLFGKKKAKKLFDSYQITKDDAMSQLKDRAEAYEKLINEKSIEERVDTFINSKIVEMVNEV
jgi:hypothetical protein